MYIWIVYFVYFVEIYMSELKPEDVKSADRPEVKVSGFEHSRILSWLSHNTWQIAKGIMALIGLTVLGGGGVFSR